MPYDCGNFCGADSVAEMLLRGPAARGDTDGELGYAILPDYDGTCVALAEALGAARSSASQEKRIAPTAQRARGFPLCGRPTKLAA
jgi:hypothetical protein